MKNNYRSILYPLLIIIILGGLGLFFFRNQLLDFLRNQESPVAPIITNKTAVVTTSTDLEIFKSPKFKSLTNNVINFDFDNICYRPNQSAVISQGVPAELEEAAADATTTEATSFLPLSCVPGNSLPFSLK
jgi:hypothetical protein